MSETMKCPECESTEIEETLQEVGTTTRYWLNGDVVQVTSPGGTDPVGTAQCVCHRCDHTWEWESDQVLADRETPEEGQATMSDNEPSS